MAGYKQHMASLKAKMGVSATKDEAWAYCTIKKLMDMACDKAPEPVGILNEQSIVQLIDEAVKKAIEPLLDGKWKVTYRNAIDLNTEIKRLQEFGKEKQSEVVRCKMEIERLTKDLMYQQQTVSPEEARLQGRVKALEKENEVYASQNGKMLKEKREHLNRIHGLEAHNKGLKKKVKELEDKLDAVMVRDTGKEDEMKSPRFVMVHCKPSSFNVPVSWSVNSPALNNGDRVEINGTIYQYRTGK